MPYNKLPTSCGNILCYSLGGVVKAEDYTEKLIPDVERIANEFGKARILLDIADFHVKDMEWAAMWEDTKFGTKLGKIERFALICKHQKIAYGLKTFLIGIEFKTFHIGEKKQALDWIFQDSAFRNSIISDLKENHAIPFVHATKYLVPIDSAEAAKCALSHALHLLRADGSDEELHLLTVITKPNDVIPLTNVISEASQLIEDVVGPRTEDTQKLKVSQHIVESSNSVAETILNVAKNIHADYIVIGTRRAEKLTSSLSSICCEVIRSPDCPVLVCKAGQQSTI